MNNESGEHAREPMRESVVEGLECLADENRVCRSDCPYYNSRTTSCFREMARDTLELLKEQNAKTDHIRERIHELINDGCCVDTDADKLYVLALIDGFFMQEATTDK